MKCPNCNKDSKKNTKFCPECGTLLVNAEEAPEAKPKSKKKIIVISIISLIILAGVIISLYFILRCDHQGIKWVTVKEPTCTEKGYQEYQCPKCGEVTSDADIYEKGHHWVGGECGVTPRSCDVCGVTELVTAHVGGDNCRHCGKAKFTFVYPEAPITVKVYSGGVVERMFKITAIEFDGENGKITWSAEMLYNIKGNNHSSSCLFGWKIYDKEGYVVDSGTSYSTETLKVGEKFKDAYDYTYFDDKLDPWQTYTIEILNIDN